MSALKVLLLVDQSNVLYRGYFSKINQQTIHPWLPTVNYLNLLQRAVTSIKRNFGPEECEISFIFAGDSFTKLKRTEFDSTYKANRPSKKDPNFSKYFKTVSRLHDILGLKIVRLDGFEGDDIIASLVQNREPNDNTHAVILSDDKDLRQLLEYDSTTICKLNGLLYTREDFIREHDFHPGKYVFYKALVGDRSDNIKGVSSWGPAKATEQIKKGSWMHVLKEQGKIDEYWHAMELVRLYFNPDLKVDGGTYNKLNEKTTKAVKKIVMSQYDDNIFAFEDIVIGLLQLERVI